MSGGDYGPQREAIDFSTIERIIMYYHVRLDLIRHDGRVDQGACMECSFRFLRKALEMIKRDFGGMAKYWRIEDLTEPTTDIISLESPLHDALLSTHQYIVLTFKDDVKHIEKYDHIQFFIVARDEGERPPQFAFSKEDEAAINEVGQSQRTFVDIFENPIDINCVASINCRYDKWKAFGGRERDLFKGMVVQEKSGVLSLVFAGESKRGGSVSLGMERIDKTMIENVIPSIRDGHALLGFIVRLTNGDSLSLTFSIKNKRPDQVGRHDVTM